MNVIRKLTAKTSHTKLSGIYRCALELPDLTPRLLSILEARLSPLTEENAYVRGETARLLAHYKNAEGVRELLLAKLDPQAEPDEYVRVQAAIALGAWAPSQEVRDAIEARIPLESGKTLRGFKLALSAWT